MSLLRKKGNDVILCCNGVKCPVVRDIGNEKIQIKDDDGNKIVITNTLNEDIFWYPKKKFNFLDTILRYPYGKSKKCPVN